MTNGTCATEQVAGRVSGRALQLVALAFSVGAGTYLWSALSPLQETVRVSLALTDNQMALLQGPALALPMLAAAIPIGMLVDRSHRVRLLLVLTFIELAGGLLTAFASGFWSLCIARSLVGLAVPPINTTVLSLLADIYPPSMRGRANMVGQMAQYAGMSAAFALGGALLAAFEGLPDDWRKAALWLNAPLLPLILLLPMLREPPRSEAAGFSWRESFAAMWRFRTVALPIVIGVAFAGMAVFGTRAWAVPVLSRNLDLAPERAGAIMAMAVLVSGFLGPVIAGLLADACHATGGPRRTVAALMWLTGLAVPAALFALAPQLTYAGALLVICMTIGCAIFAMGGTLLTVIVPGEVRGMFISSSAAIQLLAGVGLAPIAISLLSATLNGATAIGEALAILSIVVSVLGTLFFAFARAHLRSRDPRS